MLNLVVRGERETEKQRIVLIKLNSLRTFRMKTLHLLSITLLHRFGIESLILCRSSYNSIHFDVIISHAYAYHAVHFSIFETLLLF